MIIALIVIVVIVVLLVLYYVGKRNSIIASRNRVDESWSGIDVQLKRRHDLVPNLVETVKGYASHEKEVFEKTSKARADAMAARGPVQAGQAEANLSGALTDLRAVAENYPELRATENFQQLSRQLSRARGRDPGLAADLQLQRAVLQHLHPAVPRLDHRQPERLRPARVLRDRGRRRPRARPGQLRRLGAGGTGSFLRLGGRSRRSPQPAIVNGTRTTGPKLLLVSVALSSAT